ncbi:MAG: Ig-like domain-containing protein, partial [Bacteroidaceae bacterium]|nr:Ig-like domain-containing protein [Bacteroidaceae bacterium]
MTANSLGNMVDSFRVDTRESARLNFLRWPYLLQHLSLNPRVWGSWDAEMDNVKRYVMGRVAWMDKKLHYTSLDSIDGVYQIYTARDLCRFSELVQAGENKAKALVRADLDMLNYSNRFIPLGTNSSPFGGVIDGGGHTIYNLQIKGKDNVGMVSVATTGCVIKNLTLGGGCTMEGDNYVAGFVGNLRQGSLTLTNCGFEGTVTATGINAAAFVAYVRLLPTATLTDCYNAGTITANNRAAAMIAPSVGVLNVTNSYNVGQIVGVEAEHEFAYSTKTVKLEDCYDLYAQTQVTPICGDSVTNGWLCFQLNAKYKKPVWYQNLDNGKRRDQHPVLSDSHGVVIYENGIYTNNHQFTETYQYYRLEISKVGSNVLQIAEFSLLDGNLNEMPVTVYKGPQGFGGEDWPNIADQNVQTKFCGEARGTLQFFFDAGEETGIYGYTMYTANDTHVNPERNPKSWRLYGSNVRTEDSGDSSWKLIDERIDDATMGATSYVPYNFIVRMPEAKVTISKRSARLNPEATLQLAATVSPSIYEEVSVQWRSTNEDVAIVSSGGLVQANAEGSSYIVASLPDYGDVADTCLVVVRKDGDGYQYYLLEVKELQGNSVMQLSEFNLLVDDDQVWSPLSIYSYDCTIAGNHAPGDMVDG